MPDYSFTITNINQHLGKADGIATERSVELALSADDNTIRTVEIIPSAAMTIAMAPGVSISEGAPVAAGKPFYIEVPSKVNFYFAIPETGHISLRVVR